MFFKDSTDWEEAYRQKRKELDEILNYTSIGKEYDWYCYGGPPHDALIETWLSDQLKNYISFEWCTHEEKYNYICGLYDELKPLPKEFGNTIICGNINGKPINIELVENSLKVTILKGHDIRYIGKIRNNIELQIIINTLI